MTLTYTYKPTRVRNPYRMEQLIDIAMLAGVRFGSEE